MMGGVRNCQTESPDERAMTSSWRRLSFKNANIEPNKTAKGSTFSDRTGNLYNASVSASNPPKFSLVCPRRKSSTISMNRIITRKIAYVDMRA